MSKSFNEFDEAQRLEGTAPDRRTILDLLEDHGRPLQRRDIVERLGVDEDTSREILRRRLKAMVRDGQLVKNRRGAYGIPARMDLLPGRVSAHPDG
jgi:ribonuclease R